MHTCVRVPAQSWALKGGPEAVRESDGPPPSTGTGQWPQELWDAWSRSVPHQLGFAPSSSPRCPPHGRQRAEPRRPQLLRLLRVLRRTAAPKPLLTGRLRWALLWERGLHRRDWFKCNEVPLQEGGLSIHYGGRSYKERRHGDTEGRHAATATSPGTARGADRGWGWRQWSGASRGSQREPGPVWGRPASRNGGNNFCGFSCLVCPICYHGPR